MNVAMTAINDIASHLLLAAANKRILVAIAGPPGVGKSTFAEALSRLLNSENEGCSAVLPMDGFHFDNIYLDKMGWRSRKGAPHTFDVGGLGHMLERLIDNNEEQISIPIFDRDIEVSRAAAAVIPSTVNIILVEGNYLLLDEAPWLGLGNHFETTIALKSSYETIRQRLIDRWQHFDYTASEIEEKLKVNDLPNAKLVLNSSVQADFEFSTEN